MRVRVRHAVVTIGVASVALIAPMAGANGSIAQSAVVREAPSGLTPHVPDSQAVNNSATYAFSQVDNAMYAGGDFDTVQNPDLTQTYTRTNLFSFDVATGAISSFAPQIDGPVWALANDGQYLYVGGDFTSVDGFARQGIAKIDLATQTVVPTFDAKFPWGRVTEVRLVNNRLIVGGKIPGKLLALDPVTGANTGYINLGISGQLSDLNGRVTTDVTGVYKFAVSPDGSRLVAIGNFTTVAGQPRSRAFMVDLGATSATLDPWYYQPLTHACRSASLPDQLRDVDFSPEGSYFVLVATGWVPQDRYRLDKNGNPLNTDVCDAAARFETNIAAPTRPTWINYTGGDTLHSVAITGAAVYVQGHQRWLDNPYGVDYAGPGGVARQGIGAINPDTGHVIDTWNPGKTRRVGGKELYATSAGLWVGSDGRYFRKVIRDGIAFCPLP